MVVANDSIYYYSLARNYTTFRICDFVHMTVKIWNAIHAVVHIQDEIIRVIPICIQKLKVLVRDAVLRALLVPVWDLAET